MIVIDASVVVYALADDGPAGSAARQRLEADTPLAPHLLDVEVLHMLRRQVRLGTLEARRATRAVGDLARMALTRVPHQGLIARAWELRDNLSAYDAVYVSLAETLEVPLVTADGRLAWTPGMRCAVEVLA